MRELSLYLLDLARNSIEAGATELSIILNESDDELTADIVDNGSGMTPDECERAMSPFFTTRVTKRNIGLGIPLFKMRAELTGGSFSLRSDKGKGTQISAIFKKNNPEYRELGDMPWTIAAIISGQPDINLHFRHSLPGRTVTLETASIRDKLEALPLSNPEVLMWLAEYLKQQYQ